jgi:hypothetical protein
METFLGCRKEWSGRRLEELRSPWKEKGTQRLPLSSTVLRKTPRKLSRLLTSLTKEFSDERPAPHPR